MTRALAAIGAILCAVSIGSTAQAQATGPVPLAWGAGVLVGEHQVTARGLFGFDVAGRFTAGVEGTYGVQLTPDVDIHGGIGYRQTNLCPEQDPTSIFGSVCDAGLRDSHFFSVGAGADFLYGEDVRVGWFIDARMMIGRHVYAAPMFGLASRYALVVSSHQAVFFEARLFVEPWIPFDDGVAPVVFGLSGAFSFGMGATQVPPSNAQQAIRELDELARETLAELIGDGADPVAACSAGVRGEWSEVAAACAAELTADLEAGACALWVAHDPDERNLDLRAWIGSDRTVWNGNAAQRPAARVQDAAADNWPVVTLCNTTAAALPVHLQARTASTPTSAIVRRYVVSSPLARYPAPPLGACEVGGQPSLIAGGCCLVHVPDGQTAVQLTRPAVVQRISLAAPYYANGVSVSEALPGVETVSRTIEPSWDEGTSLDLRLATTSISLSSASVGIPIHICDTPVTATGVASAPEHLQSLIGTNAAPLATCIAPFSSSWSTVPATCAAVINPVAADTCAVWFVGGASGDDLDLRVEAGGLSLADEATDAEPYLVVCNTGTAAHAVTLETRAADAVRWAAIARYDVAMRGADAPAAGACGATLTASSCCFAHVSSRPVVLALPTPAPAAVNVGAPAFAELSFGGMQPNDLFTPVDIRHGGGAALVLESAHPSPVLVCTR